MDINWPSLGLNKAGIPNFFIILLFIYLASFSQMYSQDHLFEFI